MRAFATVAWTTASLSGVLGLSNAEGVGRFWAKFNRAFGATESEPAPNEPVELIPWVGEFEAGAIIAQLASVGIDAVWPPSNSFRGPFGVPAFRGPVVVRFEDLPRARRLVADIAPLDDEVT